MKDICFMFIIICLSIYSVLVRENAKHNEDMRKTYYDNYCITEYYISLANPSDPVVLALQEDAKKYKICNGFVLD